MEVEGLFLFQDAESFLRSRRSIRFFSNRIVEKQDILSAIDIANCAPSACNRQPCKVYFTSKKTTIGEIGLFFKNAYRFENGTPQIIVLTGKLSLFSSDEYLQPLVNGGMYASYLLLALHAKGIATTPLEMCCFKKPEMIIRKRLGIPNDEIVITAMAIGYPMKKNKITCGARRCAEEVLVDIDN